MASKGLDPQKVVAIMYNPQNLFAIIEQREIALLEKHLAKLKEDLEHLKKLLQAANTPNAKFVIKYDRVRDLGKKIDAILAEAERVGHHHDGKVVLVYNPKGPTGKRIDKIMSVSSPNMGDSKKGGITLGLVPPFGDADDKDVNQMERDEDDVPVRFHCPVAQAEFNAKYLAAKKRLGII